MRPLFIFTVIGLTCSNVVFGLPDSTQTKSKVLGVKKTTEAKKPTTDEKVKKKEAIKSDTDKKEKVSKKTVVEKKKEEPKKSVKKKKVEPTKQAEPKVKKETPKKKEAKETKEATKPTEKTKKKEVKATTPTKNVKPAPKTEKKAEPKKKKVVKKEIPSPTQSCEVIVDRAAICTGIVKHEPKGSGNKFKKDIKRLYCFSHITGVKDTLSIYHQWFHQDKEVGFSLLKIKSSDFRTHSYRDIEPNQTGNWRVDIINSKNKDVLKTLTFSIE